MDTRHLWIELLIVCKLMEIYEEQRWQASSSNLAETMSTSPGNEMGFGE